MRRALVISVTCLVAAVAAGAPARAAAVPKPKITAFAANPSALTVVRQWVWVTATMTNAQDCEITVVPPAVRGAGSFDCTSQAVDRFVFLPFNASHKAKVTYRVSLIVHGTGGTSKKTAVVKVWPSSGGAPADWGYLYGGAGSDGASATAIDGTGVYMTGSTTGALPSVSDAPAGGTDGFIAKYSRTRFGGLQWAHRIGGHGDDEPQGIATDSSGSVYVVGCSSGPMPGSPSDAVGGTDAFVQRWGSDGTLQWTRMFGSSGDDCAQGVVVTSWGVVVVGQATGALSGAPESFGGGGYYGDAFVAAFDASGNRSWVHLFGGTGDDVANGVAATSNGSVVVVGGTTATVPGGSSHGGTDAFSVRYDSTGASSGVTQTGTSGDDWGQAVASRGHVVAVSGYTQGALYGTHPGATIDQWVFTVDDSTMAHWQTQFPIGDIASGSPGGSGVAVDALGRVYLVGSTTKPIAGAQEDWYDSRNGYVVEFSSTGLRQWVHHLGVGSTADVPSAAADDSGVVAVGTVTGSFLDLDGAPAGNTDAFVISYLA